MNYRILWHLILLVIKYYNLRKMYILQTLILYHLELLVIFDH